MTSRPCREDGMALAEVLVAIGVLTVGLLGSAQLLVITTQTHVLARETTDATRLAQAKVEGLVKADFATDPRVQVSGVAPDPLAYNATGYYDMPTLTYTRRWRVLAGPTATTPVSSRSGSCQHRRTSGWPGPSRSRPCYVSGDNNDDGSASSSRPPTAAQGPSRRPGIHSCRAPRRDADHGGGNGRGAGDDRTGVT